MGMKLTNMTFASMCEAEGFPRPWPEFRFCDHRRWRFDWAFPLLNIYSGKFVGGGLAVEIEGGIYGKGRACPMCGKKQGGAHGSVAGKLRDICKYRQAATLGWRVLPVLPQEFESGKIFEYLKEALPVSNR